MVSQTYDIQIVKNPVTGNYDTILTTTDLETGVVNVSTTGANKSGQIQESSVAYTPAQWEIRQQIQQSGATLTPEAEEQIAQGLQNQVKTALAGGDPEPFQVKTPEAVFSATGGYTAESLRGATGSVLKKGYTTSPSGEEVPASQTFRRDDGSEFTATPIKRIGRQDEWRTDVWLWETGYGQISADPKFLKKEIERKLSIDQLNAQLPSMQEVVAKKKLVQREANTLPARLEFALEHPTKGMEYMIGSTLIYGNPLAVEGIREYQKEREKWMEALVDTKPIKIDWMKGGWVTQFVESDRGKLALRGMFEPVTLVAGAKVVSMLPGISEAITSSSVGQQVFSHAMAKPILTGVGLGVASGITAIGTAETVEGVRSKDITRTGKGVLLASAGAMGIKYVYEAGVYPELLEAFPPKIKGAGMTVSDIQEKDIESKVFAGEGKGGFKSKVMGKEFETKIDYKFLAKDVNEGKMTATILPGKATTGQTVDGKFVVLSEEDFGEIVVTKELSRENFFGSIWKSANPKGDVRTGISISEKELTMMYGDKPFITTFKTASASGRLEVASLDVVRDLTLLPSTGGAEFGMDSGMSGVLDMKIPDTHLKGISNVVEEEILKTHVGNVRDALTPKVDMPGGALLPGLNVGLKDTKTGTKGITMPDIKLEQVSDTKGALNLKLATPGIVDVDRAPDLDRDVFNVAMPGLDLQTRTEVLQDSLTSQLELTQLQTDIIPNIGNPTVTPVEPDIQIPGGIPFGLPNFGFKGGGRRGKSKGAGRGYSYAPSFTAIAFNIRGRMPKVLTGLEIRPIVSRRRKRK